MIVNYGDILKDQSGTAMNRGEGACFLVVSDGRKQPGVQDPEAARTPEVKDGRYMIMEISDTRATPMGPMSVVDEDTIGQMKNIGNLCKMVWEET